MTVPRDSARAVRCGRLCAASRSHAPAVADRPSRGVGLEIVPITFRQACAFITRHHRHHRPPQGMKFAVGVTADGTLAGVAVVGRPVARHQDDGRTAEVTRTCTDGTPNANSALYGATWRAARALGYRRLITYTEDSESGTSLRAAGFRRTGHRAPGTPSGMGPPRPPPAAPAGSRRSNPLGTVPHPPQQPKRTRPTRPVPRPGTTLPTRRPGAHT
ncbi:XF1762 family protein [Streptomyces sp. SBT349]|uniref:XF1762 family protein n=1 Tax=Streptomyces sp. SBT349 TaxID=1580539 RepID=UPI000AAB8556|nr:XF1762 family protein [Streptomyces sp. SBT349]